MKGRSQSGDSAAVDFSRAREADGSHDPSAATTAWRGIDLCRRGHWQKGLYWLSQAADSTVETSSVPSLFFSYLGYGLARYRGELEDGLDLCRRAVKIDLYQAENYVFLARTLLLHGDRREALDVVERGLQIDAHHPSLVELRAELGRRRSPILPFLPRKHFLNRTLGRFRHRLFGASRQARR